MSKKENQQALEAEVADAVTSAVEFTCTIYAGGFNGLRYATSRQPTLEYARAMQRPLEEALANGRKAMIYAVQPCGKSVFVPDSFKTGA
jgi:hypothetical protein